MTKCSGNIKDMIKRYLKKSLLWKYISKSNNYQKLRFPKEYKKRKIEPDFYKAFLKSHESKSRLIFDVGANLGHKSGIFSKIAKEVLAFEPSKKLFDHLQQRFQNTNVQVFNYALGSEIADAEIFVVEDNEAYNSINRKHIETTTSLRGIATLETVKRQKTKIEILENFIRKFGVPKYIKIDVEGFELEVLKGLHTAVPLLSFEANLPEFKDETIQSIKYLNKLSNGKYRFNFSNDHFFLEEDFMNSELAINYINHTKLEYLEIYAKLIND